MLRNAKIIPFGGHSQWDLLEKSGTLCQFWDLLPDIIFHSTLMTRLATASVIPITVGPSRRCHGEFFQFIGSNPFPNDPSHRVALRIHPPERTFSNDPRGQHPSRNTVAPLPRHPHSPSRRPPIPPRPHRAVAVRLRWFG